VHIGRAAVKPSVAAAGKTPVFHAPADVHAFRHQVGNIIGGRDLSKGWTRRWRSAAAPPRWLGERVLGKRAIASR
jgi:hypothetical protein